MARSKTAPPGPDATTPGGTYFLSLTVENVRCFGPAQTLDLSDGHGGHAPWTIILGENGLGKTTLLTCLAGVATVGYALGRSGYKTAEALIPYLGEWIGGLRSLLRGREH